MNHVALVGKIHSGKTTLAKALIENHRGERMAFADPVKRVSGMMLAEMETYLSGAWSRRPPHTIEEMNNLKGHPAIRKLLQLVGTELGRDYFGPDTIWIDKFKESFLEKQRTYQVALPIVNDDCRFPNEAEALKELGFTTIRLVRDEGERQRSIFAAIEKNNPELAKNENDTVWESSGKQMERVKLFEQMNDHPSEKGQERIKADIEIPSVSVEELQKVFAPAIRRFNLDELREWTQNMYGSR